ncbi:thiamine pyrophosphate-dependent enzyme [Bradyrhizobium sp. UFLA05-109]
MKPSRSSFTRVFTAGGNSPTGYTCPAAIGESRGKHRQVISHHGDSGVQLNIQKPQAPWPGCSGARDKQLKLWHAY